MASFTYKGFTREQMTTRGADPTVVVRYVAEGVRIEEYQGVVLIEVNGPLVDKLVPLAEAFYKEAEDAYAKFLDEQFNDEGAYIEVEAAERAAGWDPKP